MEGHDVGWEGRKGWIGNGAREKSSKVIGSDEGPDDEGGEGVGGRVEMSVFSRRSTNGVGV